MKEAEADKAARRGNAAALRFLEGELSSVRARHEKGSHDGWGAGQAAAATPQAFPPPPGQPLGSRSVLGRGGGPHWSVIPPGTTPTNPTDTYALELYKYIYTRLHTNTFNGTYENKQKSYFIGTGSKTKKIEQYIVKLSTEEFTKYDNGTLYSVS